MRRSVEGLILNKFPYGERHLICHLLLRSGNKVSVLFMGGRGGGKKLKPGVLEPGYLVEVELRRSRFSTSLPVAGEWFPRWIHQNIRFRYQAFHLMCFFLEMVGKIATEEDLHSPPSLYQGNEKTFGVLANGLFFLEQKASAENFCPSFGACVFLSKLLIAQGVFPTLKECVFCGSGLCADSASAFLPEQGGFACMVCCSGHRSGEGGLWQFLVRTGATAYRELSGTGGPQEVFRPGLLLAYFCYQFHLDAGRVRTGDVLGYE